MRRASTPTRASCAIALAGSGAVLDLSIDGETATPVVLKEAQRHPVRGETRARAICCGCGWTRRSTRSCRWS